MAVFGARGYEGATTDEVARPPASASRTWCGCSARRRTCSSRRSGRSSDSADRGFRAALAEDGVRPPAAKRIGEAYVELINIEVCTRPCRTHGCWAATR